MSDLRAMRYEELATAISTMVGIWLGHDTPSSPHGWRCAATEGRMEWANLTGEYQDVTDYARMCVPCHRKFDAARRALTGRRTSPRR